VTEVLVVDDEPSVRLLLRDILEMEGYDVMEAPDGPAALEMLAGHRPDCVLLDVMMPGMSGIEVLGLVRADEELTDLPVMMLTAASDDQTTWSGWSAGADYYLPKPFDVEHLLKWVEILVADPVQDLSDDVDMVLTPVKHSAAPVSAGSPLAGAEIFRLAFDEVPPTAAVAPAEATAGAWQEQFAAPLGIELDRALRTGQIWVAYQPIVALGDDRIVGVEAFARWRHPQRGDVAPSEFVPVAESSGLADELGWTILLTAARQVAEWNDARQAAGLPALLLSVNVSGRHLAGEAFLSQLLDRLTPSGLAPELLVLEVGESALAELSVQALAAVELITAAGVRLCLDDFGPAEASIAYLRNFPVAFVKVDRSIVRGIGENSADDAAVTTIVTMAHRIGRTVVAEGVETRMQAQWLASLGCDLAQGFHFAHPAKAGHLSELILGVLDGESSSECGSNGARALASVERNVPIDPSECDTPVSSARLDRLDRALSAPKS
jgi:EAL domain-containing protein (putative c-di-GMP-specific phosphodiesterase class I)/ActR/RegA family two-component response regulator